MSHKNFKSIEKTVFGRGSFAQLDEILAEKRHLNNGNMVFIVDAYFQDKALAKQLPLKAKDLVYFIDVDLHL